MSVSAIVPAVCVVLAFAYVLRTYVLTRRSDQKETPARVVRHVPMTERELARLRWPWEVDERELGWAPVRVSSLAEFEALFAAPRETTKEREFRGRVERKQSMFAEAWGDVLRVADSMVPGGVR
jgi:hypothetical protein